MERQNGKYSGIYVFEGIDNVGKTTIVGKLKEKIYESVGCDCVVVAFPGNEPRTLGNLVYDIHHNQARYFDEKLNETSLQLLHISAHIDLIDRKLRELNQKQSLVLLDRYWWSTYAYGIASGMDESVVQAILEVELMKWRDLDIKKIFLIEREFRQRDYEEDKDKKIIELYRELAGKESESVLIENNGSIEAVVAKIYDCIVGAD